MLLRQLRSDADSLVVASSVVGYTRGDPGGGLGHGSGVGPLRTAGRSCGVSASNSPNIRARFRVGAFP